MNTEPLIIIILCSLVIMTIMGIFIYYSKRYVNIDKSLWLDKNGKRLICGIADTFLLFFSLILLWFCVMRPKSYDNRILVENSRTNYWYSLGMAETKFIEISNDDTSRSSYVLSKVKKDGFAGVSYDDLCFYLNTISSCYPMASYVVIQFDDGMGIEIFFNSQPLATYGRVNESGRVDCEKVIDISNSLSDQIDGLTTVRFLYDYNINPIYEGHFDSAGNLVDDANGVAEYFREYDKRGHVVWEKRNDSNGIVVMNSMGTEECRRIYEGDNLVCESFFDGNGELVICKQGYAIVKSSYDDRNRLIEQSFYDVHGNLVISTLGYAVVRRDYIESNVIIESYYDDRCCPLRMPAGFYSVSQRWEDGTLIEKDYLDIEGNPIERTDGYSKAVWKKVDGALEVHFFTLSNQELSMDGINLVKDVAFGEDGWSEWMTPQYDVINCCFSIGSVNLGENVEGDNYTCYIEIEFKDVEATKGQKIIMLTQGSQDGNWSVGNVWNHTLIDLADVPDDGIYAFTSTQEISGDMTRISIFDLGFRCDYWTSGSFRVRNVKVEKGNVATAWSQGI